jgi:hypothetical protein
VENFVGHVDLPTKTEGYFMNLMENWKNCSYFHFGLKVGVTNISERMNDFSVL